MKEKIIEHEGKKYRVIEVIEEFKTIKFKNKEFRIYTWENKLFSEFKIPKEFRLAKLSEGIELIEEDLIKLSGKWELFFCKNPIAGVSRLFLGENFVCSDSGDLAGSDSDGRVLVVKK